MTATNARRADERQARITWSLQEPGHYAARVDSRVVGHVILIDDGAFIAFDADATPVGRHRTLRAAQIAALRLGRGRHSLLGTLPRNILGIRAAALAGSITVTAGAIGVLALR